MMQDLVLDKKSSLAFFKEIAIILLGGFALDLLSKFYVFLPFTPVPITMQNTFALFLGVLLGSKRGAFAVCFFLLQRAFNLPVGAGNFTIPMLLLPTTGYLLGYAVGAYIVGKMLERKKEKSCLSVFCAMSVGMWIVYLGGIIWLMGMFHFSFSKAILCGICPFIPGDLLKTWFFIGIFKLYHNKFKRLQV